MLVDKERLPLELEATIEQRFTRLAEQTDSEVARKQVLNRLLADELD